MMIMQVYFILLLNNFIYFNIILINNNIIIGTPSVDISFRYNGVLQKFNINLPLTLNKFFEPTEMNGESFFARWKNLGG